MKQNDLKYNKWSFFLTQSLYKKLRKISAFEFQLLQCHDSNELTIYFSKFAPAVLDIFGQVVQFWSKVEKNQDFLYIVNIFCVGKSRHEDHMKEMV